MPTSGPEVKDNLAAALDLAAAGYRVFPVRVVWNATKQKYDKVPATEHGFKNATTDEATIRAWWTDKPTLGIAVATGNGLVVVDIDAKDPSQDGFASLTALEGKFGPLSAECPRVITPSNGQHIWIAGRDVAIGAGLRPGIDWRGEGGYAVVPPTVTTDGKASYRWAVPRDGVLPTCDWMLELLREKKRSKETGNGANDGLNIGDHEGVDIPALIEIAKNTDSGGEWRECMLRVTARLCSKGLSKHEIIEMLILAGVTRHDMGYTDDQTRAELGVMIDGAAAKWGAQDNQADDASADPEPDIDKSTLAGWLARDIPPRDYLHGHLLYAGSRMLIDGDTGLGKSRFAMRLAYAAAAGTEFLHWPAGRPCNVLYVDYEMGADELRGRVIELIEDQKLSSLPNLHLIAYDEFDKGIPPLDTEAGQRFMLRQIERFGAEFIIIDNLMASVAGQVTEETWKAVEPFVFALSRRGTCQLWLHHTGHDKSRAYGTRTMAWKMTSTFHLHPLPDPLARISFEMRADKPPRSLALEHRAEADAYHVRFADSGWASMPMLGGGTEQEEAKGGAIMEYRAALREAIQEHGSQLPDTPDFPDNFGVQIVHWKKMCERRGLKVDASFRTYKMRLIERNVIREKDLWVWFIK